MVRTTLAMLFSLVLVLAPGPREAQGGFTDTREHWSRQYVDKLEALGAVEGYPDGTFRPDDAVTRASFVTILLRALNIGPSNARPDYADNAAIPDWAGGYVTKATAEGIVWGYEDGTFKPDRPVNRAEMAALISRASDLQPGTSSVLSRFDDGDLVPSWARGPVAALLHLNVLRGRGTSIDPLAPATRGEASALIVRLLEQREAGKGESEGMKPSFEVYGYYPIDYPGDKVSFRSLEAHHDKIDGVAVFAHPIDAAGEVTGRVDPDLIALARREGVEVLALVHNMRDGVFDTSIANAVLTNPDIRAKAVKNIHLLLSEQGYSGVNIDIESVAPRDSLGYTTFIQELSQRLGPAGYLVTVSIPAKTWHDPNNNWSGAFDYAAIGRWADKVMLMTYDEHWFGGPPGPVASLGWVERVISYAVTQIPREKIYMGIAAYGYDWPPSGRGRGLPASRAISQAASLGATIHWDDEAHVPTYSYYQGNERRIVYFENAESTALKLDLARRHELGGVAIWRLGHEDPGIWKAVERFSR